MEDNSSYTYTYEKKDENSKPERSLKLIFAGVIAALAIFAIALGIFFGVKSGSEPETTTEAPTTVPESTTAPAPKSPYNPGSYTVNTDGGSLMFRKDHSSDAETILEISDKTELDITEVFFDATAVKDDYMYWGKTEFKGHTGWVAMKYMKKAYSENVVTPDDTTTTAEAVSGTDVSSTVLVLPTAENESASSTQQSATEAPSTTAAPSKYSAGDYIVSTGGNTLTFRKGPGTNNETILSFSDGMKITVLEVVDTASSNENLRYWGKVSYQGHTGYVCMTYLKKAG